MAEFAHGPVSRKNAVAAAAIVLASALLGMLVNWRAPGLELYTRDWLMRLRGPLPAPDDIAIVAIDEHSIARYGRFPWPRSLTARALARALGNLVSNAVKYSPRETEVAVRVRRDGAAVAIEVEDHGYGIPEADLERVFD